MTTNIAVPMNSVQAQIFPRFVANRFHIYFLSSGCLYHYRISLISFFTDELSPQNAVQSSIFNALQIPDLHVTTRALGIVGKLVTGPWMRLLGQETSILGMNEYFREAFDRLTAWAIDASLLRSMRVLKCGSEKGYSCRQSCRAHGV